MSFSSQPSMKGFVAASLTALLSFAGVLLCGWYSYTFLASSRFGLGVLLIVGGLLALIIAILALIAAVASLIGV